jgi:hypothetical protein
MTVEDYITALLARRMWQEAQSRPEAERKTVATAVGLCLRNRVSVDASWLYVLAHSVVDGVTAESIMERDPFLLWCIWEAEAIVSNRTVDSTGGANAWSFGSEGGAGNDLTVWPGGLRTFRQQCA